jgi:hypothetical protein
MAAMRDGRDARWPRCAMAATIEKAWREGKGVRRDRIFTSANEPSRETLHVPREGGAHHVSPSPKLATREPFLADRGRQR